MEEMKKSYYAIIPSNVRYDKDLTPNAKLLYGEITALCNDKGFCWATNEYFASLYNVSEKTITRLITNLKDKKYVFTKVDTFRYNDGTVKKIRYIYINEEQFIQAEILDIDHIDKINSNHIDKNVPYNNTIYNNTLNNNKESNINITKESKKFSKPTIEDLKAYCEEKGLGNVDVEYFYDYYESNGWQVGKSKMKDYKATLRNWNRRNYNTNTNNNVSKEKPYEDKLIDGTIVRVWNNKQN